jgi:hypothetical protein
MTMHKCENNYRVQVKRFEQRSFKVKLRQSFVQRHYFAIPVKRRRVNNIYIQFI